MVQDPVPAAVVTMDCAGTVVEFSSGAETMFGYRRDEAVGRRLSELIVPPRLREAHEAGLRRLCETGDAALLDTKFRVAALRRDGAKLDVEVAVSRTRHDGCEAFIGIVRPAPEPAPVDAGLLLRAELFRALVEHSPNLVAVFDRAGRTTYASPAAVALFGTDGMPSGAGLIDELTHPDDVGSARQALRRAAQGHLTEPVELRLRDRSGAWRAVAVQTRDLRDHPAVTGTVCYATDAARVRAAERRERIEYTRLLTLVESLKVGVLVQDEHRRVVLANSAFVEMFDPFAAGGASRSGAGVDRAASATVGTDEVVRRGRPVFGAEVALADGRVMERDYVPITLDGSTLGHLWVFHDVTANAEARRTLQERNRILTELSALKTEFVAVVSHELRTPLTSIATFAELLDGAAGLDAAERTAAVGAIRRNADRMLSLVADLVLLARLESGELTPEQVEVDLVGLLHAAAPEDADRRLRLSAPPVAGDEDLLRQMLDTVFGVVTPISSATRVDAEVDGAQWTVRIDAETTEPATTERLLSTRLPHPGYPGEHRTGALALMLARAVAARHGGNLATSVSPTSVTVTLTLPVAPATDR